MVNTGAKSKRMVLLAEGRLSSSGLRMTIASLLYIPDRIVAIIDSTKEKQTSQGIIGFGGDTPVVHNLDEAMEFHPDSMLIGVTPLGGVLPAKWREIIIHAMQSGLHIVSGMKQNLIDDEELHTAARMNNVTINDLRFISNSHLIRAQGSWRKRKAYTILTVGTDSNTGKMTTALMMYREMKRRNVNVALVGTGPTGILISGRGIAVEAVTSDFLEGAVEFEIDQAANEGYEYILIEGQSALTNCGNSAVAMGLLHGSMPDAMIVCHQPSRLVDGFGLTLPPLKKIIQFHENLMGIFKQSKVIGIGLNSIDLNRNELGLIEKEIYSQTGLHAVDPLRESAVPLVDELLEYFSSYCRVPLPESASEIHDRTF